MRDPLVGGLLLVLGASTVVGCGGSGPVDFFDSNGGRAGSSPSGGSVSAATAGNTFVSGGSTTSGGSDNGSAGSGGTPSDAPCSPVLEGMNGMSGPFGTMAASCWRVSTDIAGWGCNNTEGRTVKVNGTSVMCAQLPLPDKLHGDYYFEFSAGDHEYASFYWF